MIEPGHHVFTVSSDAEGQRLDLWLAGQMPHQSRTAIRRHIQAGDVLIDRIPVTRPSHPVRAGRRVEVTLPPPASPLPVAEAIPLPIVHEDAHLIVIDKPPGLVVHPGKGNLTGTLVNALLHHAPDIHGVGGVRRPGIVHRLDKGTSGLLVVAKDDLTHRALTGAMRRREIHRHYHALAWGSDLPDTGTIHAPVARDPRNRLRMAVLDGGRSATTHWHVVGRGALAMHLRLELETGRTHQIRVHLAHRRHPVVGDETYGGLNPEWLSRLHRLDSHAAAAVRRAPRPMLHAAELDFVHPATGQAVRFRAPLPLDFLSLAEVLIR